MALQPLIGRHHPVALKVRELLDPVFRRRGVELVDIHFVEGGGPPALRVYADQPGGISINTLQELSETVGDLMDAEDPVPVRYTLEVSSPGVDRPLTQVAHFEAAQGEECMVVTTQKVDGSRKHKGILTGIADNTITVIVEGQSRAIALDLIDRAHTVYKFEQVVRPGKTPPPQKKKEPSTKHRGGPSRSRSISSE